MPRLFLPTYVDPSMLVAGGSGTLPLYGAPWMWLGNTLRPTRSDDCDPPNGMGGAWYQVFDAGLHRRFVADHIAAITNCRAFKVEFSDDANWNSPDATVSFSHARETLAVSGLTISGPRITRNDSTLWAVEELVGRTANTNLGDYRITQNVEQSLWCGGANLTSAAGSVYLLSPRKWASFTRVEYRYMRVIQETVQTTVNGTFDFSLAMGVGIVLGDHHRPTDLGKSGITVTDTRTRGRRILRNVESARTREWELQITTPTVAEEATIEAIRTSRLPLVFVPDDTDPWDWAYVYADADISWGLDRTLITLTETL